MARKTTNNPYSIDVDSGVSRSGGRIKEDESGRLMRESSRELYREMSDLEPTIGAVSFFMKSRIKSLEWWLNPAEEDSQASLDAKELVQSALTDMYRPMSSFIDNACDANTYGFKLFEICYKKRLGFNPRDKTKHSKFSDNKVGWRKWMPISCLVINEWIPDEDDEMVGVWVDAYNSDGTRAGRKPLALDKAIHLIAIEENDSPEGRSLQRGAKKPYTYKKRHEEIEAVASERCNGFPVGQLPEKFFYPVEGSDDPLNIEAVREEGIRIATLNEYREMTRDIRVDSLMGAVRPGDYNENGDRTGWGLDFLSTGIVPDSSPIILRYANEIARAMNADLLMMGEQGSGLGNGGLGDVKAMILFQGIGGFVKVIQNALNESVFPKLMRLNGMDPKLAPTIEFGDVNPQDVDSFLKMMQAISMAGIRVDAPNQQKAILGKAKIPEPEGMDEDEAETTEIPNKKGPDGSEEVPSEN